MCQCWHPCWSTAVHVVSLAYEAVGLPYPTHCKVRVALSIPVLGCCQGCCRCQQVKGFGGLCKEITGVTKCDAHLFLQNLG